MNYNTKIRIFKFIRIFLNFFNLQLFYSKKINYLKNLQIDNIIDVGVADGTDFLFNNFPKAKYFFIEPNSIYHEIIENKLLKKYNGKIFKIAAGNQTGKLEFFNEGVASSFLQREDYKLTKKIYINVDKLDNILKNEIISGTTLLKIDTEGFELDVLKGSEELLKKINYCIVEIRLQKIKTYNPSEIIKFLLINGFYWDKILKVYYAKEGVDFIDVLFIKK